MKLNNEQYSELVDKLASEIAEELEVMAAEEEEDNQEGLTDEQIKRIIEAKKQEIAENEQAPQDEDEAEEIAQKSAAVYEYAMRKIAACEDFYNDGIASKQACIEVLAEAGLMDEYGLNKEAAESTKEAMEFTNKIAEIYDDADQKIMAAQEKYAEACEEANAALEVLASLGLIE